MCVLVCGERHVILKCDIRNWQSGVVFMLLKLVLQGACLLNVFRYLEVYKGGFNIDIYGVVKYNSNSNMIIKYAILFVTEHRFATLRIFSFITRVLCVLSSKSIK